MDRLIKAKEEELLDEENDILESLSAEIDQ